MFDISTVCKRYFEINLSVTDDEGKEYKAHLEVEPPKIKVLKKITALSKVRNEDAMEDLAEAVGIILSKNKTGYKVPQELIDELNFDEMNEILTSYFEWLAKSKNSPN